MPDKITLDDAISQQQSGGRITFDDAMAERQEGMQPGGRLDVRPGGELIPGEGLPGSPMYRPPMVAASPMPAPAANFGTALKAAIPEDQQTKLRVLAGALFPNDPNGIQRVGLAEGRPVFVNDSGQLQFVSGPWSRMFANVAASAPETVGAAVGSLAQGQPITGAATGAAGGRALKRGLSQLMFDEPATPGSVGREMATEAGITAAGGLLGKGLASVANKGRVVDFTPAQLQSAEQARTLIKQRTGIDLDLAQASGDRMLLGLRDYAAKYPGRTAEVIQARDEITAGQLDAATNRVLDLVAKAKPAELTGKDAIGSAQAVIATLKGQRDAAVQPFYDAARQVVIGADVVESLASDPLISRAARRIASDPVYQRKLKGLPENSVGYWQQVKRNLNAGYEKSSRAGDRTAASEYADAADIVNKRLAAASPEYALANEHYAHATREIVTPTEDSLIGVLAQMHPKNAQLAARIFNDPGITAGQVAVLKAGISRTNPDAYRGLVRQWLGQKYNMAMRETQSGDVINPAGKFRQAVIGTPSQKDIARAMLPADAADAFDDLMMAAEKLARTPLGASRIAGSPTASNQIITEKLKGMALNSLKWMIAPRQSLQSAAEQRAVDQGIDALTTALIDPAKRSELRRIVKMKDSTRQLLLLAPILSVDVAASTAEASGALGDDVMPAAYRATP